MKPEISPSRSFVRQNHEDQRPRRYRRVEKPNFEPLRDSEKNYTKRPPLGRVVVLYDGTLSEKLEWDQDKLDKFSQSADLRSIIKIISSPELDGSRQYETLGEVVAWKRIANPLDLLQRRIKTNVQSSVDTNDKSGEVRIVLRDQQISHAVREKNSGKFVEGEYVRVLNTETQTDIQNSLNWEKLYQTVESMKSLVTLGAGVGLIGVSEYFGAKLTFEGFKDLFSIMAETGRGLVDLLKGNTEPEHQDYIFRVVIDVVKTRIGSLLIFQPLHFVLDKVKSFRVQDGRYRDGLFDFNPLKHGKDWLRGSFFLKTKGRSIVNLRENELTPLDRQ